MPNDSKQAYESFFADFDLFVTLMICSDALMFRSGDLVSTTDGQIDCFITCTCVRGNNMTASHNNTHHYIHAHTNVTVPTCMIMLKVHVLCTHSHNYIPSSNLFSVVMREL